MKVSECGDSAVADSELQTVDRQQKMPDDIIVASYDDVVGG